MTVHDMRVGLVGAMDEEVRLFQEGMEDSKILETGGFECVIGHMGGNRVYVLKSGIGKVNAARATQLLLTKFRCDIIINTGLCGSIGEPSRGDVFIPGDCIQHDVRAEAWGYERGEIPLSGMRVFKADEGLLNLVEGSGGRLLTGDLFLADSQKGRELAEELGGSCVDMEGGAVAQVCSASGKPFLLVKIVSDSGGEEATDEFEEFVKECSRKLYDLNASIITRLEPGRDLKACIRTILHFPREGVMFRDITSLLLEPEAFSEVIEEFACRVQGKADIVAGIESRGLIFGAALAHYLGLPFVPLRKAGKLPGETLEVSYELEYGSDSLEVHTSDIRDGDRVVLVDDLIATGGTIQAAVELIENAGGQVVDKLFVINLPSLQDEDLEGAFWLVDFKGE